MMADPLTFNPPDDAALLTAELLVVAYVREDGENAYMVHGRGDMPATWFLGMTLRAQDEIRKWDS